MDLENLPVELPRLLDQLGGLIDRRKSRARTYGLIDGVGFCIAVDSALFGCSPT